MKQSIRKAVSGRTMRVATTFTGAAACAVAFTPLAMAGTAHVAHQPALKGMRPDIYDEACKGGTSHWLHLANNKGSDWCFGYSGTISADYLATSYCGGTNHGWIQGQYDSAQEKGYFAYFGPGNTYAHMKGASQHKPVIIESVHITSWSGNDKCGFP